MAAKVLSHRDRIFRRRSRSSSSHTTVWRGIRVGLVLLLCGASGAGANAVVWHTDWKAARALASSELRPILLDFAADWCGPCRAMDEHFWPQPEVQTLTERFVLVRVDFDVAVALRREFGVSSIPNVVVLDPWQNRLGLLTGWSGNPSNHLALLNAVPRDFRPIADDARAAAEGDGRALERLGELYFPTPLAGASMTFFEKAERSKDLKLDPARRAVVLAKIGWCEIRLGDAAGAKRTLEKALKVEEGPRDLALAGLAVAWAGLGNLDRADSVLEELRASHAGSEMLPLAVREVEKRRAQVP